MPPGRRRTGQARCRRLPWNSKRTRSTLHLDERPRDRLARKGYDPSYGARPLKRVIQGHRQDPLAERILAGDIADGDPVNVSAGEAGLLISGAAVRAEAA
jgi:ATP-dependent Clp protease ATP-binding subunit ClpB